MENIYKDDLGNRFASHTFNITKRGSLVDIEVLDENLKVIGSKTCGDEKSCHLYARRLLGVDDHILPILTLRQKYSLKKVPHILEVMVVAFDEEPVIYTKYRWEKNRWV